MRDNLELDPAIIFVESPGSVCTLDRAIFAALPHKKIILVDGDDEDEQAYFSDKDVIVSTSFMDHTQLDDTHRWLADHFQVDAVLGFTETSVYTAAYLAEKFDVEGIGTQVALRCRNKYLMIEALRDGGVRIPDYFLASRQAPVMANIEAIGGFPVICKPLMGFAGCGVVRADNEIAVQRAVRKITFQNKFTLNRYYDDETSAQQILIQRFIAGDEFAIDGYVRNGEAHIIAIIDKPDVSNGPYFDDRMHVLPSKLGDDIKSRLNQVAQACVTAIGLDNSPFHLEARISDGEIYVLEIAARIGFMRSIQDALGIDLCAVMVALKMGQIPEDQPKRRRYAGNLCVTSHKVGEFVGIGNLDAVMSEPNVVDIPLFVTPGSRVSAAPDANAYIGYILSAADEYETVERALHEAAESLDVVIE